MAQLINQQMQSTQLIPSLDIYHLPQLDCDVVMSEYSPGEQIPVRHQQFGSLKVYIIHGKAELISSEYNDDLNQYPSHTSQTRVPTEADERKKLANENIETISPSKKTFVSGDWCEISSQAPLTLSFSEATHCLEFWFA